MDIIIQEGMIVGKTLGKNKKGCGTHDYLTGTILHSQKVPSRKL